MHIATTLLVCPFCLEMTFAVLMSHNLTVPSSLPLATLLPFGDNDTVDAPTSPSRQLSPICAALSISHSRTEPSYEHAMTRRPVRCATSRTPLRMSCSVLSVSITPDGHDKLRKRSGGEAHRDQLCMKRDGWNPMFSTAVLIRRISSGLHMQNSRVNFVLYKPQTNQTFECPMRTQLCHDNQ